MSSKSYPTDILAQAIEVLAACRRIDPELGAGKLNQVVFAEKLAQAQQTQAQLQEVELQRTELRNLRDDQLDNLWDIVKRMRAMVKGGYGDDSSAYELVGGTRSSERKRDTGPKKASRRDVVHSARLYHGAGIIPQRMVRAIDTRQIMSSNLPGSLIRRFGGRPASRKVRQCLFDRLAHQRLIGEDLKILFRDVKTDHILRHQNTDQLFFRIDPIIGFRRSAPAKFPD